MTQDLEVIPHVPSISVLRTRRRKEIERDKDEEGGQSAAQEVAPAFSPWKGADQEEMTREPMEMWLVATHNASGFAQYL